VNALVSIVILTYRRPQEISRNVEELLKIDYEPFEIIVVNNGDAEDLSALPQNDSRLRIINLDQNIGVGARNIGIRISSGVFIVTLDDDVFGLRGDSIQSALEKFGADSALCAINFKVIDDLTENQVNWMHHRKIEDFYDVEFETYEISEGAVVFRKELILQTELYPESFFISHEGPDLALQIMKLGARVIYFPRIIVRHSHAEGGRTNWRPYYYDTRNQIWLAARHYPLIVALRKLSVGLGAMLIYSIRDGFLGYFFKGVFDGISGIKSAIASRKVMSKIVLNRYLEIEKENPSLFYMLKKRIFNKKVRI
jgi:GT2 family glycosyltransferase